MTRDQLIEKRKKKKRMHRIAAVVSVAGITALAVAGVRFMRSEDHANPGEFGTQELTEVEEIISEYGGEEVLFLGSEAETVGQDTGGQDADTPDTFITESEAELDAQSLPASDEWEYTDEGVFYRYADGSYAEGFVRIDGDLYCFGYDGVMLDGWQKDGENLYYFSPDDGKAVTGERTIDGKLYFFDEEGINDPSATVDPDAAGLVALTFDDGPGYYTDQLLDVLDEYGAKATFFMVGEEVRNYPDQVLREYEMGMEQGNHSWDHTTLTHLSGEDIEEQFRRTNELLESITGGEIELFRAPGGGLNDDVYENSLGMKSILWSIDTLDWQTKDAQQTYDMVINNVRDGDIILMHEIYESSLEAARMIIPKLQEMGYRLVTVSELAAAKGVEMGTGESYGCFY